MVSRRIRAAGLIRPAVAVILPPRQGFSDDAAGAIALLVRRLSAQPGAFQPTVIGRRVGAPFPDIPFRPVRPWLGYGGRVASAVRSLGPALVEVHNRPALAMQLARLGPPVTLFLHNDPLGMRGARTADERAALGSLAAVVTVSAWLRDRLDVGFPVDILPNCVDIGPTPSAARDNLILFAGRMVADKGADSFVEACALALPRLPGWRAAMIGGDRFGPRSPTTPFLRRLIPRARAAGIILHGWQPHAAVLAAMARAAIAVVPSRWPEPFGLTALEAMAAGTPLLCAMRGGLPEVVGDAAGPIDPDDSPALAAAIVALAGDTDRRTALAAAGRRRAALFDTSQAAAALDALRRRTWSRDGGKPI